MNERLNHPIIKSLIDSDLYKYTMQYAVCKLFPTTKVKYKFIDRNNTVYPDGFDIQLKKQIEFMKYLHLTKGEKSFMKERLGSFLPDFYLDFLEGYQYDPSEVNVWLDSKNHLHIEIDGYMYRTILWEVPILALVSELYYIMTNQIVDLDINNINDINKIEKMIEHNAYFSDFGMRRRFSYENQDRIIKLFLSKNTQIFVGTSNVHFAHKYNINIQGTCAHEWIMVHAAIYGYKMSNKLAMDHWIDTYGGQLGTMLVDTFTTDIFLKSFDSKYARLYDGVRHDSGCPFEFVDKFISHYKKLRIDPMSKTIIFSDGLDIELATQIKEYCVGKIKSAFGIGTHLTNNVLNTIKNDGTYIKPLNIVIKVSDVFINDEWYPTVKLSDNKGKNTGKVDEVNLCKQTLNIKN